MEDNSSVIKVIEVDTTRQESKIGEEQYITTTSGNEQEDGDCVKPEQVVLKIMIDKEKDIKSTISLLKKEIAVASTSRSTLESNSNIIDDNKLPDKTEFQALSNLLADDGVNKIIKSIAGENTKKLIDKTMVSVNSKQSADDKHKALANGIKKLQTNLRDSNSLKSKNDPRLNLAFSLLGIKKDRLI